MHAKQAASLGYAAQSNQAGATATGGYITASAIPKEPTTAESLCREMREQLSGIGHHTERLEGFADRLCGAHPKDAAEKTGTLRGCSHADALIGFRDGLTELGARLNDALNRLESFV